MMAGEMLAAGVGLATPLLLGALGAILAERGGSSALSLEGQVLAGALAATAVAGPLGVGAAMVAGLAVAGVPPSPPSAAGPTRWRPASALTCWYWGSPGCWHRCCQYYPPAGRGRAASPGSGCCWCRCWPSGSATARRGWRCGRRGGSAAAIAAGLRPARLRALGMLAGGLLGGLAGAALALQQDGGTASGRGYLALAAVIIGRWRPGTTLVACLGCGCAEALLPAGGSMAQLAPFALALLALAVLGGARVGRRRSTGLSTAADQRHHHCGDRRRHYPGMPLARRRRGDTRATAGSCSPAQARVTAPSRKICAE
ncbi:hypothetical protein ACFQU2_02405 [Siccirubricoccus deserti]